MYTLSLAIMAVPDRSGWVNEKIIPRLDISKLAGFDVFYDTEKRGAWWNAKRCWQAAKGTHHVVLQDDAILGKHIVPTLIRAININPTVPIALFGNSPYAKRALKGGTHWVKIHVATGGPGHLMPTTMIKRFLSWEAKHVNQAATDIRHRDRDDARITAFYTYEKIESWMIVPCLIQHPRKQGLSSMGHRRIMYADVWVGNEDPLQWDLTLPKTVCSGGTGTPDMSYWYEK